MRSMALMYLGLETRGLIWAIRRSNRRQQVPAQIKGGYERVKEGLLMDIAWALPRELAKWCYVRVVAHATMTGEGNHQEPDQITYSQTMKRWKET